MDRNRSEVEFEGTQFLVQEPTGADMLAIARDASLVTDYATGTAQFLRSIYIKKPEGTGYIRISTQDFGALPKRCLDFLTEIYQKLTTVKSIDESRKEAVDHLLTLFKVDEIPEMVYDWLYNYGTPEIDKGKFPNSNDTLGSEEPSELLPVIMAPK